MAALPGGVEARDSRVRVVGSGLLVREVSCGLEGLGDARVDAVYVIRHVVQFPGLRLEVKERHEVSPRWVPQPADGRILGLPAAAELGEAVQVGGLGRGSVDRLEVPSDCQPVLARSVAEGIP